MSDLHTHCVSWAFCNCSHALHICTAVASLVFRRPSNLQWLGMQSAASRMQRSVTSFTAPTANGMLLRGTHPLSRSATMFVDRRSQFKAVSLGLGSLITALVSLKRFSGLAKMALHPRPNTNGGGCADEQVSCLIDLPQLPLLPRTQWWISNM